MLHDPDRREWLGAMLAVVLASIIFTGFGWWMRDNADTANVGYEYGREQ